MPSAHVRQTRAGAGGPFTVPRSMPWSVLPFGATGGAAAAGGPSWNNLLLGAPPPAATYGLPSTAIWPPATATGGNTYRLPVVPRPLTLPGTSAGAAAAAGPALHIPIFTPTNVLPLAATSVSQQQQHQHGGSRCYKMLVARVALGKQSSGQAGMRKPPEVGAACYVGAYTLHVGTGAVDAAMDLCAMQLVSDYIQKALERLFVGVP